MPLNRCGVCSSRYALTGLLALGPSCVADGVTRQEAANIDDHAPVDTTHTQSYLRHEHLSVNISFSPIAVECASAVFTKRLHVPRFAPGFLEPLPLHVAQVTLA